MSNAASTATADLRREHELILAVADALERIVDGHRAGRVPDVESMSRFVSFIRLYADACHHEKEETLLFPALGRQGLPVDDGPIAVMLHEHDEGRVLVGEMADSLGGARSGDDAAVERFVHAAAGYVGLIRDHISKENTILFEMADQLVTGEECRDLCDRYGEVDEGMFEGRSKAELELMAADLVTGRHPIERNDRE